MKEALAYLKTKALDIIGILIVVAIWALILFGLGSCNAEKQAARQQAKAESKVLSDYNSFNKIGKKWAQVNPCVSDSVIVTKSDTVTNTVTDTVTDTIVAKDTVFIIKRVREVETRTIRDTVKATVTDNRQIRLLQEELSQVLVQLNEANKANEKLKGELSQARDDRNDWRLWFWILLALGIGTHLLRSKFKL